MNKIRIALILSIIGFALSLLSILSSLDLEMLRREEEVEPVCEVVNGRNHIYRGQCLPEDYVPEDLVPLSPRANWLNTKQYLTLKAKVMVEQLIEEAEKDGMCLVVTSGYRSYEEQEEIYDKTSEEERDFVAEAGSSEHQTGLAVDFSACPMDENGRNDRVEREELEEDFEDLPEYRWLQRNAWRYGFEESYTTENIELTGYPPEAWHWMLIK